MHKDKYKAGGGSGVRALNKRAILETLVDMGVGHLGNKTSL